MAILPFDATNHEPLSVETPAEFALRLWMQCLNSDDDMDFTTACELAPYDREVFKALQAWAWSTDIAVLSEPVQATLARALIRKMPPTKGTTERRNVRLTMIARRLVDSYGLSLTAGAETSTGNSASEILATLPGTPASRAIANIITRSQKPG